MRSKQLIKVITAVFVTAMVCSSLVSRAQQPWEVPVKFKAMANPVKADDANIRSGNMIYQKNCASCHGKTGLGDGPKARTLDTPSGDFSGKPFQSQTDGELFYKSKFGRGDMPKYENKIPDEDIWKMVHYMRTFKK